VMAMLEPIPAVLGGRDGGEMSSPHPLCDEKNSSGLPEVLMEPSQNPETPSHSVSAESSRDGLQQQQEPNGSDDCRRFFKDFSHHLGKRPPIFIEMKTRKATAEVLVLFLQDPVRRSDTPLITYGGPAS
uniref:Uncharacterized protein n=1 Tax=Oryzias sinensis TaxID=183150 RepID=A0A8C7WT92_9TELE